MGQVLEKSFFLIGKPQKLEKEGEVRKVLRGSSAVRRKRLETLNVKISTTIEESKLFGTQNEEKADLFLSHC